PVSQKLGNAPTFVHDCPYHLGGWGIGIGSESSAGRAAMGIQNEIRAPAVSKVGNILLVIALSPLR
ncbi:MAG: hypothetical protein Q8R25_01450, partial [bacterium]|nr:hypothetical protein [bacterium]